MIILLIGTLGSALLNWWHRRQAGAMAVNREI